jgi:hypothetical protein
MELYWAIAGWVLMAIVTVLSIGGAIVIGEDAAKGCHTRWGKRACLGTFLMLALALLIVVWGVFLGTVVFPSATPIVTGTLTPVS